MKVVKSPKESGLLVKEINETFKVKQNDKKKDFFQCYMEH